MKTKEELNALRAEVETLNKKLAELTDDELRQVAGGAPDLSDIPGIEAIGPYVMTSAGNTRTPPSGGLESDKGHPGYVM